MTHDLVVLGNLLLDDVVHADGTTRMGQAGGAALYVALGAALWGLRVGLVSVRGSDYPAEVLERLDERGIDCSGLRASSEPCLRTWLLYEGPRRRVVHRLEGPGHDDVSPRAQDIPAAWRAHAYHLAPLPLTIQADLVGHLAGAGADLVSLDPYELLETAEERARWLPVLAGVDLFFLSEDELPSGRGQAWRERLRRLASGRLRHVFFKRGAAGGSRYDAGADRFCDWEPRTDEGVVDATGAGDAFAAGVLAGLLRGEGPEVAVRRGLVGASYAVASPGPDRLLAASRGDAEALLRRWFG